MKLLLIIILFFSVSAFAEEETSKHTLLECQASALQKSQRLSIAGLEVNIARERIHEIQGINIPKLSAEATYNVRDKHPGAVRRAPRPHVSVPKPPKQNGASPQKVEKGSGEASQPDMPKKIKTIVGNKQGTITKVSLVVPIYDFGYVNHLVGAQKSLITASEAEKKRVEQGVLLMVAQSYYTALESARIEVVVLQSIKLLGQQLAVAKDLFEVGLVTKNDVLGVEVQLGSRQQELIQARHNIENALANLNRLTELDVRNVSELVDVREELSWEGNLGFYLDKVNDSHPELQTIYAKIQAAEWDYGATRAENYPDINAFCNFNTSSDSYLLHRQWIHTGVGIQIPIFDGGIVASKLLQNKDQQKELKFEYDGAFKDICLQVREAFLSVDAAYSKVPVAKLSILHAEENLKIDKDLYQEGLIASDDLLNDEERLAEARSNYFQALYSFKIAESELAYAIGDIQND